MDVALTKLDNSDLLDTSILGQVVPLVENVADPICMHVGSISRNF